MHDEQLAHEGGRHLLQDGLQLAGVLLGGEEHQLVLDAVLGREQLAGVLLGEGHDQRQLIQDHPLVQVLHLTREGDRVAQGLVHHDGGHLHLHLLGDGLVGNVDGGHVVQSSHHVVPLLVLLALGVLEVAHDGHLHGVDGGLQIVLGGVGHSNGTRLLLHVVHDVILRTARVVVHGVAVLEELQSGVTTDSESLAQLGIGSGIHFSEIQRRVQGSQFLGGSSVLGSELLAVTAPLDMIDNQEPSTGAKNFTRRLSCWLIASSKLSSFRTSTPSFSVISEKARAKMKRIAANLIYV